MTMKHFKQAAVAVALMGGVLNGLALDPNVKDKAVYLSPEESRATMTVYPGYEMELFASEVDFPIDNPVAMQWDQKGRLWIANAPTYPHIKPDEKFKDSIVVLEDKDHDGKADTYTVFADNLYIPMGFVVGDNGVYVSNEPNLMHLQDTDGDGIADKKEIILHGFGSEDSHHAISAFQWAPDGSFYMAEGTFLVSNVETPWGVKRTHDSAVWRFKPSRQQLDVFSNYGWSNPWGIAFDKWGHPILLDASPGQNYYLPHLMSKFSEDMIGPTIEYPGKHAVNELSFFKKGRPNSGAEFVSSHNFPPEVQGTYLNGQCIGFHGIRWITVEENGSGILTTKTNDLVQARDTNFRPIALQFGPDGALYVCDYYNNVIGHMQYEFRDTRRGVGHGRIWRIRYKDRPLSTPVKIAGEPVETLLNLLKDPILRTRYQARRELQERGAKEVLPATAKWLKQLDSKHPDYDLHRLEAFWIYQSYDEPNFPLLEELLKAKESNVRATATMAMRFEAYQFPDTMKHLRKLIFDPNMRVRLEAVNALSCMDSTEAAALIIKASEMPMDFGLYFAMKRSLDYLQRFGPIPGYDNSVFSIRKLSDGELVDHLSGNWPDQVGYEILSRNGIKADEHSKVIAGFRQRWKATQAEVLFRVADSLKATGKDDVGGIARRLAGLSKQDSEQGREAFTGYLKRDAAATDADLRRASYAGLLHASAENAQSVIKLAEGKNEVDMLMAGSALITDAAVQGKLYPVLLAYVKGSKTITAEAVRDAMRGAMVLKQQREDIFKAMADLAENGGYVKRRGAISAMQNVPYKEWPKGYDQYAGRLKINGAKLRLGAEIFRRENFCGQCHMSNGEGVPGAFPPLQANQWVEGDAERMIKVAMFGLEGPLEVHGVAYNAAMPPMGGLLNDEEMAAVLTYVRTSWDNTGTEIMPEQVAAVRAKYPDRAALWQVEEIVKDHPIDGWTPPKAAPKKKSEFE